MLQDSPAITMPCGTVRRQRLVVLLIKAGF